MGMRVIPAVSSMSRGRLTAFLTRPRRDKVALLALLGIAMLLLAGLHCFTGLPNTATSYMYGGNSCVFTICVAIITLFIGLTLFSHAAFVPGLLTIPWMDITFLIEKPPRTGRPFLERMLVSNPSGTASPGANHLVPSGGQT